MSEYVFKDAPGFGFDMDGQMETLPMMAREYYASNCADHYGTLHEEIVRCRDCKHYYVAENYHPSGTYIRRCCKYFDTYDNEVEPYGFCVWGERREQ